MDSEETVIIKTETETNNEATSTRMELWTVVESELNQQIPKYLKNLLRLCGFDTPITLKQLTEKDIVAMEIFGREEMELFVDKCENPVDYFDKYVVYKDKFKICGGHRVLLTEIQKCVQEMYSRDKNFLNPETKCPDIQHDEKIIVDEQQCVMTVIDEDKENYQLYMMLKKCLQKLPEIQPEVLEKFSISSVQVNLHRGLVKIEASVLCPVCDRIIKAHKHQYGEKGKSRWIKANFERHIKFHFEKSTKKKRIHQGPGACKETDTPSKFSKTSDK